MFPSKARLAFFSFTLTVLAFGFDAAAQESNPLNGCTDVAACNYNPNATLDDGSCLSCAIAATFVALGPFGMLVSQSASGMEVETSTSMAVFNWVICWICWVFTVHVGDCGGACTLPNASSTCVNDVCVIAACDDGFADYNGLDADGCEGEVLPSWSCGENVAFDNHTYTTVEINGQCWFAENLRSTSYANGEAIPSSLDDAGWSTTSNGARATFGEGASVCYGPAPSGDACNETFSLASYGRLYNWHAVNDIRGLCPTGWHIPSDEDWTTLIDALGGSLVAGSVLKSSEEWFNNGVGLALNGFEAFPGGQRMNAGNFQGAGTDAFFGRALRSIQGKSGSEACLGILLRSSATQPKRTSECPFAALKTTNEALRIDASVRLVMGQRIGANARQEFLLRGGAFCVHNWERGRWFDDIAIQRAQCRRHFRE